MKHLFILCLFAFLGVTTVNAQVDAVYNWAKSIGGTGYDNGNSIAIDTGGNVYVTGSFQGTVDFDPSANTANLVSAGNNDIFIAKYSANGNYIWANRIGNTNSDVGEHIALDASGNIYITGVLPAGTVDFDPSASTANISAYQSSGDMFIAKYNSNGNYIWVKSLTLSINNAWPDNHINGITIDKGGNICVTGQFTSTVDFDPSASSAIIINYNGNNDIFIAKYTANGSYLWAKSIGPLLIVVPAYENVSTSLAVDTSGNFNITGSFGGVVDFDPSANTANLGSAGTGNMFIAKYSANGNYIWANAINGIASNNVAYSYGIALDMSTNVYVTGSYQGTVDFDPSANTAYMVSSGYHSTFIAKYSPTGNYLWAKGLNSTYACNGEGITVDSNKNVYIRGSFQDTIDMDPSSATVNVIGSPNNSIFIAKYNSLGNYIWGKGINEANSAIYSYDMALDANRNVYVTGNFMYTVDFDPSINTANLVSSGGTDFFIAKYSQALICTPTTGTLTVSACNSYTWAAKGNTVYTSSNNTDTVHLTNAGGCDSLVTLNLTIKQPSTSTTNVSVCANALPYVWNNYAFNIAGAHIIHLSNAVGCDSAVTLNLTINPISTSTTNITICASALPYSWNGLTFNAAGSQTYHTNNSVGCDSAATLNLTVLPLPTVNAGADTTICPSGSSKLTATGAVSYSWTGGVTNGASFSPAATTTYVVTGTAANGCSNTDTVIVNVRDLTIASITPVICKGVADTLTAPSGSNYQWKKNGGAMSGKTSRVISLTVIGSYTVTYTDSLCGLKTTPAVVLTLTTPPTKPILAATKAAMCPGDTTTLYATTSSFKFIWLLGSTTTILSGATSLNYHTATIGTYYIKAVDSFGCRSAVSGAKVIKASVVPIPAMTVANGTLGSKKLTCTNNSGTYQWRLNGSSITGATAKTYTATQSGSYSVRFTNGAGCAATTADTTLTINYTGPKMSQEALTVMNNQEDIKVYPNPSSDIFFIEASEATKAIVTDLQGSKVLETNDTHQINLKENPSGIYFLQLMNEEGMLFKTEKLIKE